MSEAEGTARGRKDGVIGWVIFDNPRRLNAISSDMAGQALEVVRGFEADGAVRVIVLRGEGTKAFISGGDISKFEKTRTDAASTEADRQNYNDLKNALQATRKPVIAMIHGYCLGGGMGLALAADIRLAASSARLGIPAAKRAIGYPIEQVRQLLNIVGPAVARDVLFSARQIEAPEALQLGLVNRVFPTESLERETIAYATILAENAPLSIAASKFCIDELLKDDARQDRARMQALIDASTGSEDFREATRSFMEKRRPVFRGV